MIEARVGLSGPRVGRVYSALTLVCRLATRLTVMFLQLGVLRSTAPLVNSCHRYELHRD
jgi:hypothetical protein